MLLFACFPALAQAKCVELKNDTFDQSKKTPVTAIRSFCLSESFGAIFKAEQDFLIQKVRVLISGDGKTIPNGTAINIKIFKEKAGGGADPGASLGGETPYQVPSVGGTAPQWLEIKDLKHQIKKGESFRIVIAHELIDCELRATGALCADSCGWWSATSDNGPIKPKANVHLGTVIRCKEIQPKGSKWRFVDSFPAGCKPPGNLIIRVMGYDGTGKDCLGKGGPPAGCTAGATQACTCTDGKNGSQSCQAGGSWAACQCQGTQACTNGTNKACTCGSETGTQTCTNNAWAACQCKGAQACTPGGTQECVCAAGKGAQTCKTDGSGWGECSCGGTPPKGNQKPTIEKITPNKGPVGKNTEVTIIGKNFVEGAKVRLGTKLEALNVKVVGPTTITAVIPAEAIAGLYNLTVENPDGQSGSLLEAFTMTTPGGCSCSSDAHAAHIHLDPILWLVALFFVGFRRRRSKKDAQ